MRARRLKALSEVINASNKAKAYLQRSGNGRHDLKLIVMQNGGVAFTHDSAEEADQWVRINIEGKT